MCTSLEIFKDDEPTPKPREKQSSDERLRRQAHLAMAHDLLEAAIPHLKALGDYKLTAVAIEACSDQMALELNR